MAEYIDREAAMAAVCHAWAKGLEPTQYIEAIPAADVAPVVRGQWEFGEMDVMGTTVKCSCCGWTIPNVIPNLWMAFPGHKFCGCCGAKMQREE